MPIDDDFLAILACPQCHGSLRPTDTKEGLVCDACALEYEIRDNIPILLIDEAKPVTK